MVELCPAKGASTMVGMPLASGTEKSRRRRVCRSSKTRFGLAKAGCRPKSIFSASRAKSRLRATSFSPASIIVAAAVKGQKKGTLFSCCASLGRDSVVVFMRFAP